MRSRPFSIRTLLHALLAAALLGCLLAAAPASASRNELVLFDAPNVLLNPATRPAAIAQLQALGVHAIRVVLYWHDVAPSPDSRTRPNFNASDPSAYNWGQYDALISQAEQLGWQVLLTVSGPVPRWATPGGVDTLTRPDPLDFERFMTAVGSHYGSYVKLISIWNEPNQPQYLLPQYVHKVPVSPMIYRGLWEYGYRGLQASGNFQGMKVLFGETSPVGNPHVVAPLTFLRGALCLDSNYRPLRHSTCSQLPTAGYAQHPYTLVVGPFYRPPSPNAVTVGVLARLTRALDLAARAGAIPRNLPIYETEFGIQSFPDPFAGVSLAQQAEFDAISEHMAYSNRRVVAFSQYLLRDDALRPGNVFQRYSGFFTGLELSNGKKKPSYAAWPVPLTVTRHGGAVALWGDARPATGVTTITVQTVDPHGHWRDALTARTNSLGYWTAHSSYRRGRRWRLVWTSPAGVQYLGPPIRAYSTSGRVQ